MTDEWDDDELPEPYAYNAAGEPIYVTDEGGLIDLDGQEYEIEDETDDDRPEHDQEALDAIGEDLIRQNRDLENDIGRKLTPAERHAVVDEMRSQVENGHALDLYSAHLERGEHYDLDNTQERRAYIADSLKDGAPPAPVSRPAADAPAEDHREYMRAQLQGAEVVNDLDTEE